MKMYEGAALSSRLIRRRDKLKSWILILVILAAFAVVGYIECP